MWLSHYSERVLGRVLREIVIDPKTKDESIVTAGTLLDEELVETC